MSASKKTPTAYDRTLSLFTRKTDAEDPNARDGQPPDPPRYAANGRPRKHAWERVSGSMSIWDSKTTPHRIIREPNGVYVVLHGAQRLGVFDNICEAADAVERP